jgi:hypothetical protein
MATLQLLCCVAALLFGWRLFIAVLICIGTLHAMRSLASLCALPWFPTLIGFVPAILFGLGTVSAITVSEITFPDDPNNLPLVLSILTAVYATTYGFCLFAGLVDCMAIGAAAACLKSLLVAKSAQSSQMVSNPLLKAVSLASLGVALTVAGNTAVQLTIMRDLKVATTVAELARTSGGPMAGNDRIGEDSWLDVATAVQTRTPGNVCAGLSEQDRISMLPNGRALVRRAVTRHPSEWRTEIRWPLTEVYVTRCNLV